MATNRARIVLMFSLLTLPLTGCLHVPDPVVPMPLVRPSGEKVQHSTAIVLLPGIRDRGQTFVDEGFFDAAMLAADVYAADAHFGYYRNRTAVERLYQDILLPLKRRGYEHIWLAGISLGGFGAVLTAAEYPGVVDGLVLLSPYMGDRKLAAEVQGAGGLQQWKPGELDAEDYERRALSWLRDESRMPEGMELFLGFGTSDDFAPLLFELRPLFPDERFVAIEGGHDWPTWRRLWTQIAGERFPRRG
jgi:pimeloyl-ACP methyl ester carboxylesterase